MSKGRGNAVLAVVIMVSLMMLHIEVAQAAIYTVGGAKGWNFNVASWTKGKRFRAGDVLVFKYTSQFHSVYAVNKVGYTKCLTTLRGAKGFKTGKDRIKLVKGNNYFICGLRGHCLAAGMKLAITAF